MLFKYLLDLILTSDEPNSIDSYPDALKITKGIISDAKNRLITIEAHAKDMDSTFIRLVKDKKFESMIDGYGMNIDRENLDFEDGVNQGYFLTVLLDSNNEPILIWDPLVGKLSYDQSIQSYINCDNKKLNPPYLLPVEKSEMLIVGDIIYKGNDAYLLEMEDDYRECLLMKLMNHKQSIFIKGKEVMDYLTENHIDYREKCNHILFDYKLDDNIIRELMICTTHDGNYNVQGVYFLDENLDLDTVHFIKCRKRFVIEIKNERAFYISTTSDDSYAFNLNTR